MNPLRYKVLMLVLGIFLCEATHAQIGLRIGYDRVSHKPWSDKFNDFYPGIDNEISSNLGIGIDYGFRLKSSRIEFYPTVYYSKSNSVEIQTVNSYAKFNYHQYLLRLNTHLYFLDFFGDCDCPTWSNDNEFIKKGLFLHIGPELGLRNHNNKVNSGNSEVFYGIGGGMGLDMGLSKWLTVTPIFRMGYRSSTNWDNLSIEGPISDDTVYYGAEIRLGFRFDPN